MPCGNGIAMSNLSVTATIWPARVQSVRTIIPPSTDRDCSITGRVTESICVVDGPTIQRFKRMRKFDENRAAVGDRIIRAAGTGARRPIPRRPAMGTLVQDALEIIPGSPFV